MQDGSKVSAKLSHYSSQVTLNYKKYSVKISEIQKVLRNHGSSEASQLHCKAKNYYLLLKDIRKLFKLPTCDMNAHFSFAQFCCQWLVLHYCNVLSSHRLTPIKSFCNRFHYEIILSLVLYHTFKLLCLVKLFNLDAS